MLKKYGASGVLLIYRRYLLVPLCFTNGSHISHMNTNKKDVDPYTLIYFSSKKRNLLLSGTVQTRERGQGGLHLILRLFLICELSSREVSAPAASPTIDCFHLI